MDKEEIPKPILLEDLGMIFATKDSKERKRFGMYECGFCGTEFKTQTSNIKKGNTKSCGCYNIQKIIERNSVHKLSYTKLYRIFATLKDRVLNSKNKQYSDYGGRGITICDEWKNDFKSFYDWSILNGYEENKGLSIDRIDNGGNYYPENCRWVTKTIQSRNQRIGKNNTSGYKGVHFYKKSGKYIAKIYVNKEQVQLGRFSTPVEGAIAYNNYIIENNLEGFILNEIPEEYIQCSLN